MAPGSGGAIGTGGFAPSGTGGLGMAGVPATSGGSAGGGVPSGAGGSAPSAGASSGGATAGGMNTSGGAPGSGGAGTGGAGGSPSTGGNMNAGGSGAGGQPGSSTVGFDNNARITLTGVRGVGTPSQQTIKLRNRGAAALTVTGLALSGPNMDLFKVTSPATFPATVAAGGDRQDLHERIRQHSQAAAAVVKQQGGANDLLARLQHDAAFAKVNLDAALDTSQYVGRAPQQVDEFIASVVRPIRDRYAGSLHATSDGVKV